MRLAFGLGRALPGRGPLTMQFAGLCSLSVSPSSPPSPEKGQMSRAAAAAARKVTGIAQLRALPASTGGLLYR